MICYFYFYSLTIWNFMLEVTQQKDHLFVFIVKSVTKMHPLCILICKVTTQPKDLIYVQNVVPRL